MFGVFFVFGCTAVPDNAAHDSSSEKLPPALTSSQLELRCQFHPMSLLKKESSCSKYTVLKCSTLCHALLLTCLLSLTSKPCGWSNKGSVLAGGCERRAKCAVSWRFTALLGGGGVIGLSRPLDMKIIVIQVCDGGEDRCWASVLMWKQVDICAHAPNAA